MKYNFLRAFTLFIIVFLSISLEAQDSLAADSAPISADSGAVKSDTAVTEISAGTLVDSSIVKRDTVLDSAGIVLDTDLVISEQSDSVLQAFRAVDTEPQTAELTQPVEPEAAAVSEKASLSTQNTDADDEKLTAGYKEAVNVLFAGNKILRLVKTNLLYIVFLIVSVIIIIAAVLFFSTKKDGRRFLTTTRLSVLDKMVQKGCRCIESNYMNPELTVDTVCSELITGPAYLNALFVKEIGIDVQSFIVQVRVNSIRNLIAENPAESDLGRICEQCGFKTVTEAQEHFVRLCGVGIQDYRKSV
ncbi:MAG: AraC family transcriptional regulator [Chitinispirillia bacterium]|nr:AraC family transcriptional regulator [Chitinispirillia bacterium]